MDLHCLQRQDISGFSRTSVKLAAPCELITVYEHMWTAKTHSDQDFHCPLTETLDTAEYKIGEQMPT